MKYVRETFVLINCDLGKEEQIVKSLQRLENVKEVQATHGVYDIVAKIETKDEKELNKMVQSNIMGMRQVHSVLTLLTE